MKSAFVAIMVVHLAAVCLGAKVKEGKSFNLTLSENKSKAKQFQVANANLLLYFRPNGKDSTIGTIEISLGDFSHEIDSYYLAALVKDYDGSDLTFKCMQGPCESEVVALSADKPLQLGNEEQELEISKSRPIDWFRVGLPLKNSYDRILLSLRTEEGSIELDKVGMDIFGDVEVQVHEEKNRMFLVVNAMDEDTCEDCQVDILVSADNLLRRSKVYAQLEIIKSELEMRLDESKIDYLTYFQKPNFYKIEVPSSHFEGFMLEVIPFVEAVPRMRAHLDARPDSPDDYRFDSILEGEFFGDALTYAFRKDDLDGDYLYLALSGMQGLYQITFTKSRHNPVLMIGDVYTGQLNADDVHQFSLQVQPLDDDNGEYVHVLGTLLAKSETGCRLAIKHCATAECKKDEIAFGDKQLDDKDKMELVEEDHKQLIKLQPGCSNKDDNGFCWYLVGISSEDEDGQQLKDDLHYILYAELAKGHVKLQKNRGFASTIVEGGLEQLVFFYEKEPQDLSLEITVSTANVGFLVSTKCKEVKPDCAQWEGGISNKVEIRGKKLREGAYYISVQGLVTTTYTITVQVLNKNNLSVMELKEGQAYRGYINPVSSDIAYFRVGVDLDADANQELVVAEMNPDIQFNLQAAKFKLALTLNVGDDEMPSVSKFDEISLNNYLIIRHKTQFYIRQGVYSLSVQFLQHDSLEEYDDSTNIPFTLTYTTSRTVKPLNLNEMLFDEVYRKNNYYFLYHPFSSNPQSALMLSKQNIQPSKPAQQPIIHISSDLNSDSENLYQLSLQDNKASTYTISSEEIAKLCEYQQQDEDDDLYTNPDVYCQIFVSVETTTRLKYSLIIWNFGMPIELHGGHSVTFNLENIENGQTMNFFYQITSYTYDILLYIQSYYGQVQYQLKLDQYSFKGQAHNTHSKSISTQALASCKPNCILEISLSSTTQQSEVTFGNMNRVVDIDDTFSLMVSQRFLEIRNGQPIEVVVRSSKPKYFIYSELQFEENQPFEIMFQELMGRGQLCLSISDDNNLRMPFYDDIQGCDFRLSGNYFQFYPSNFSSFISETMVNPVLIVEVSMAQTNDLIHDTGKFNLMFYTENQNSLILAHPTRVDLNHTKTSATFTYFNQAKEDLEIKITRITGYAYLTIQYCLDDVSAKCIPKTFYEKTFLTGQSQQLIQIPVDSAGFCLFCTYRLILEITDEISLSAILYVTTQTEFVKLMQGIQFVDYLTGHDYNLYRVPFDVSKQLEITAKVYNGDPKIYVSYSTDVSAKKYQFGPYVQNGSRIQAIIPPRVHLEKNKAQYNITPYNPENTLASHFHEDDVYLYVSSSVVSNYTVQISQNSSLLLQDGLVTLSTLSRNQPSTKLYYYHLYADTPILTIKCLNQKIQSFNEYIIGVSAEYSAEFNPSQLSATQMNFHSSHENLISFTFPSQPGFYEITVNSLLSEQVYDANQPHYYFDRNGKAQPTISQFQYDFNLNFIEQLQLEAAVNSRDIFLIETNSWVHGSLYAGQENFYELYIHQPQSVGLQVENCQGTLNISYTQNYTKFLSFDTKSSRSLSGQNFDTLIDARVDPLYVIVQAEVQSTYKLSIATSPKPLPHGRIILGADGDLNVHVDSKDPDHITVSFKKLKCIQCNPQEQADSTVEYTIVWGSSEESLNMVGKCRASSWGQYSAFDKANFGQVVVATMNFDNPEERLAHDIHVEDQSDSMRLFISVVARIGKFNGEKIDNYSLFYKNSQVILPKNAIYMFKHKKQEFAIAVGVLLAFTLLMLCCLCYFFSRLRKLRKDQIEVDLQKKMYQAKEKQQQNKKQEENKYGEFHDEQTDDAQQPGQQ